MSLQRQIEATFHDSNAKRGDDILEMLANFRQALNRGEIRVAEPGAQAWNVNAWVKKGLALCLRFGRLSESASGSAIDLDTLPLRRFTVEDQIRVTDASCFVRDGARVSPGCTLMPHVVIQAGAYVGTNTIVDVGVGIGTCAQIGAGVHLNAGVQVQGQIQPFEGCPAIIGDGVSIGANCVIGSGVVIGSGAILFPGTFLSAQTRLYDPIRKQRCVGDQSGTLIVPPYAIVMPGTRIVAPDPSKEIDPTIALQVGLIAGYVNESDLPAVLTDRLLENLN